MTENIKQLVAACRKANIAMPTQGPGQSDESYEEQLRLILQRDSVAGDEGKPVATVDVPVYESAHSGMVIPVMVPDINKPGDYKMKLPLKFIGSHRHIGLLRLDAATLKASGLTEAEAIKLIEELPDYQKGLASPGEAGIWKQSARGQTVNREAMHLHRHAIDLYDLDTVRSEIKRYQLPITPKADKESQEDYVKRLRDQLFNHITGTVVAGPRPDEVTRQTRGPATR